MNCKKNKIGLEIKSDDWGSHILPLQLTCPFHGKQICTYGTTEKQK